MKRIYLCVWGNFEAAPDCYETTVSTEDVEFFTDDKGYEVNDILSINYLPTLHSWHSPNGNHVVTRLK